MSTITKYRYELDRSSRKSNCPQCRQKSFVRVIDTESREYLPDHVGRCDRENGCGYSYTWKQWLQDTGTNTKPFIEISPIEEPPIDYLPISFVSKTVNSKHYFKNNFFLFLESLFGKTIALQLCSKYLIGTANYWKGAVTFWQIEESGQARQCKIMLYDPLTGKRIKKGATVHKYNRQTGLYITEETDEDCSKVFGRYLSQNTKHLNLEQCFFGEHLLIEYPDKDVCIAESEKTAIIASIYLPQFNWLATGAAVGGCMWRDSSVNKVLQNRVVTFFPDYGYSSKSTGETCFANWTKRVERIAEVLPGKFRVSDILEKRLTERNGQDLADLLILRDEQTGIALTENGYPVIWDLKAAIL